MSVIVMSRDAAMRYCNEYHNKPAIMISISDPYITYPRDPFCSKRNNLVTILPLFFTDADKPGKVEIDQKLIPVRVRYENKLLWFVSSMGSVTLYDDIEKAGGKFFKKFSKTS